MRLFTASLSLQASSLITTAMWSPSRVAVCGRWGKGQDGTLIKCQLDTAVHSINLCNAHQSATLHRDQSDKPSDSLHWWQHRGCGLWFAIFFLHYPSEQNEDTDNSKLWTRRVIMDAEGWGGHCNWPGEITTLNNDTAWGSFIKDAL